MCRTLKNPTDQWPWVPSIGQNLHPLPVMMTPPYKWKILEWIEKTQTNKARGWCSSPSRDRHKSINKGYWRIHSETFDNICKCHGSSGMILTWITCLTVGLACERHSFTEWPWVPSNRQNLKLFIGYLHRGKIGRFQRKKKQVRFKLEKHNINYVFCQSSLFERIKEQVNMYYVATVRVSKANCNFL